ncbi:MAG: DUF2281 domain-containing protein [bacterium]|nr:DUF2281 domain-containing protein [bacterium]
MQVQRMTLHKIKSKLARVPEDKLGEINDFVEFILFKSKPAGNAGKNIAKLEGIWEGVGFEKIGDLETEIRKIRQESEQ